MAGADTPAVRQLLQVTHDERRRALKLAQAARHPLLGSQD